jgi:hypothetical protein
MAVSVTLTVNPPAPAHNSTVFATYVVTGNDPVPGGTGSVGGTATIGGAPFSVVTTITLPGSPPLPESFTVPQCPGLTFAATADPHVFTAIVP